MTLQIDFSTRQKRKNLLGMFHVKGFRILCWEPFRAVHFGKYTTTSSIKQVSFSTVEIKLV